MSANFQISLLKTVFRIEKVEQYVLLLKLNKNTNMYSYFNKPSEHFMGIRFGANLNLMDL